MKTLSGLYSDFSISDSEKSEFRDLLYEFICLISSKKFDEPITQFLLSQSTSLQQEFDQKKDSFGMTATWRESDELNDLFNQIGRINQLKRKYHSLHPLMKRIVDDIPFKDQLKDEIEEIDYTSNPTFFSRLLDLMNQISF